MASARPWTLHRWHRDAAAYGLVAALYFTVFAMTRDQPPREWLMATVRNVVPLIMVVTVTRRVLRAHILSLPPTTQLAAHALLAMMFSLAWLWLLTLVSALLSAQSPTSFTVTPLLIGPAQVWQLFQGAFVYALTAALTALELRPAIGALIVIAEERASRDHFLLRDADEIAPLRACDIVSVVGADDYAEVTTLTGAHLVQTTLSTFEAQLDPAQFLRVHRSAIVNLARIEKAEPAGGGRMTLRMERGRDVPVSRAGAKALRAHLL